MSTASIRKALETHLAALAGGLSTAFENVPFTPVAGTPYQEAFVLPASPDNSTMGAKHYIELGIFQVTLYYPLGNGAGDAQAQAEVIRAHFKRGTTMVQDGITVIVIKTPAVAKGQRVEDRYAIPVSITYQADINL